MSDDDDVICVSSSDYSISDMEQDTDVQEVEQKPDLNQVEIKLEEPEVKITSIKSEYPTITNISPEYTPRTRDDKTDREQASSNFFKVSNLDHLSFSHME